MRLLADGFLPCIIPVIINVNGHDQLGLFTSTPHFTVVGDTSAEEMAAMCCLAAARDVRNARRRRTS